MRLAPAAPHASCAPPPLPPPPSAPPPRPPCPGPRLRSRWHLPPRLHRRPVSSRLSPRSGPYPPRYEGNLRVISLERIATSR
eukprot:7295274-Pyramimonas_sp.AAC.1